MVLFSFIVMLIWSSSAPFVTGQEMERVIENTLFRIRIDGKYGYINSSGTIVVKPQFSSAGSFSEAMARVEVKSKMGFIDLNGRVVVHPTYDSAEDFSDGLAYVKNRSEVGYINKEGEMVVHLSRDLVGGERFKEGLAKVRNKGTGQYGFIDKSGNVVIETKFDGACDFSEGLACVTVSGGNMLSGSNWGYIDKSGAYVIQPKQLRTAGSFREGFAAVQPPSLGSLISFIDKTGKIVFEMSGAVQAGQFYNGVAPVLIRGGWGGLIDRSGRFVMYLDHMDAIGNVTGDAFKIKSGSKYGYVNGKGKVIVRPKFDYAEDFQGGLAYVEVDDVTGYIDESGNFVWKSADLPMDFVECEADVARPANQGETDAQSFPNLLNLPPGQVANILTPFVERIRGRSFQKPVTIKEVTLAELRDVIKKELLKNKNQEAWEAQEGFLKDLRVIPEDNNLLESSITYAAQTAATYFDPDTGQILVRSSLPPFTLQLGLVQALARALDAQYFDMQALREAAKDNDDAMFAISAVERGSAAFVTTLFQLQLELSANEAIRPPPTPDSSTTEKPIPPLYFVEEVIRPGLAGMFLLAGGDPEDVYSLCPSRVDLAFKSPPLSSEQVFHPYKYWKRRRFDTPPEIVLPNNIKPLKGDWRPIYKSTMGEVGISRMIRAFAMRNRAGKANTVDIAEDDYEPNSYYYNGTSPIAEGWRADRYITFQKDGQKVTIWVTSWDAFRGGDEFEKFLNDFIAEQRKNTDSNQLSLSSARQGNIFVFVSGKGTDVEALASWVLNNIKERPPRTASKRLN